MNFVAGSTALSTTSTNTARPTCLDVNFNNQNISPHATKSVSEWQRVLLTEQVPDRTCSAVVIDLSKCDRAHRLESSVAGKSINVSFNTVLPPYLTDLLSH